MRAEDACHASNHPTSNEQEETQLSIAMNSKKLLKKINKKSRRHQQILTKETGVVCSDNPSRILGICNAGQINGLTEEILIENFCKYGHLSNVLLIPGKSCSFIVYERTKSAEEAYGAANGILNIAQNGKPVYLSYVESLPEFKDGKVYDRLPPGLQILQNFITEEEEKILLSLCNFNDMDGMKHRQVKHFGYEFLYDVNNVDKDKPLLEKIPEECNFLWEKVPISFNPDQLTVNHYKPGQGIPSHIDTHSAFEDSILSLSLNSGVVMEFKRKETICVFLPPRSLVIMSGESRYAWSHGIIPKTYDYYFTEKGCTTIKRGIRISFTFRKIRKGECDCGYKTYCDSHSKIKIENELANKLEYLHVHNVYEDIAGHFSETRHKPWPNILTFVQQLEAGSVLVDVGCGNGKYFGHNKNIIEIGTDRSFKLNDLCKKRGFEIFTANCLNLPLKNNVADAAISIAVIHHLSTEERRLKAVSEIVRVLSPGGEALIYVWAKQQIKNHKKSTYIKQDRKNRKGDLISAVNEEICVADVVCLPIHTNRTDFNHSDVLVPWKLKNQVFEETFLRFYHVFEEGELEELCRKVEQVSVIKSYYDQGNYCVVLRKIKN